MVVLAEALLLGTHTLLAGGLCAIAALWEVMLPVFRIRGSTIAHMEMLTLDTHETGEQQANGGGDAERTRTDGDWDAEKGTLRGESAPEEDESSDPGMACGSKRGTEDEACSKWRGVGTDWSNLRLRTSSNYRERSDEHDVIGWVFVFVLFGTTSRFFTKSSLAAMRACCRYPGPIDVDANYIHFLLATYVSSVCKNENGSFKLDGMLPDCLLPPFSQLDGNMIRNVRPEPEISGLRPDESAACDLGLDFLNRRTPQRIQTAADRSDNDAAVCGFHFDDNIAACDRQCEPRARRAPITIANDLATRFANHDDRNDAAATGRACDPDFSPLASIGGEESANLLTVVLGRRGDPDDNDPTTTTPMTTMMTTANRQTQQQRQPQQLADDSNPEDCNADDDNPSDGSPDSDDDNLNDNNPNREATTGDDGKATKTTAITRGHSGVTSH
ncbi:hypothetical protein EDB84DRAFT_1439663 [Lactarius hengduanensis]|nr:hypothetical protein EDB84DRAFT_1439663 [Lactarius hengduanensis]